MQVDKASEKSVRITAMDTEDQGVKVFLISVCIRCFDSFPTQMLKAESLCTIQLITSEIYPEAEHIQLIYVVYIGLRKLKVHLFPLPGDLLTAG